MLSSFQSLGLCLLPRERFCLGEVHHKGYAATGVAPRPQAGWGENFYATCKHGAERIHLAIVVPL